MKKQILSALTAVMTAFSICGTAVTAAETATAAGDLNGDGKFTVADVVVMQNWLLGKKDSVIDIALQLPIYILSRVMMAFAYLSFNLMSFTYTIQAWRNLYFYYYVILIGAFILGFILKPLPKDYWEKKDKREESGENKPIEIQDDEKK